MNAKRGINTSISTNILFTGFNQGLQDGRHTDVTFKVGSGENVQEFKAYSLVLRLTSPVFDAMFSEKWNPSSVVEIPDDDPDAFRLLMKVLHGGTITSNYNNDNLMNFISILALADKYDVNEVAVNCRRLVGQLSYTFSYLDVYKAAKRLYIHDLVDETFEKILKKFHLVIKHESFLDIDKDFLLQILTETKLSRTNEKQYFLAVIKWLKHNAQREFGTLELHPDIPLVKDLMKQIRFETLPQKFISEDVKKLNVLNSEDLKEAIAAKRPSRGVKRERQNDGNNCTHNPPCGVGRNSGAISEDDDSIDFFYDDSSDML